jgi:hypothetical protein
LSEVIGFSVAWKIGQGSFVVFFWGVTWKFLLLCLPLSFLVLFFLVRIVPCLANPPFVVRQNFESLLTTLNLSDNGQWTVPQNEHSPEESMKP